MLTCDDCSKFGKPGSVYDFGNIDVPALQHKAQELEQTQNGMKKKVNPKVMNMLERYVFIISRS